MASPNTPQPQHMDSPVSVLLSIYHRIDPHDLTWALASLHQQSQPAQEVVIVLDGPVGGDLRGVVKKFEKSYRNTTRVVELAHNVGLARALTAGLRECSHDLIARLDADDIAMPQRFEQQVAFMNMHPEVAVLGSALAEFRSEELADQPVRVGNMNADLSTIRQLQTTVRRLPETHRQIERAVKLNSPINHPSAMFRKSAVVDAGGYRHVPFMEDYDLWARMIARGEIMHNDPRPLTWFRTSDQMFQRRSGKAMWRAEISMQRNLVQYGLIGYARAIVNFSLRSAFRALPTPLLSKAYKVIFQRSR